MGALVSHSCHTSSAFSAGFTEAELGKLQVWDVCLGFFGLALVAYHVTSNATLCHTGGQSGDASGSMIAWKQTLSDEALKPIYAASKHPVRMLYYS